MQLVELNAQLCELFLAVVVVLRHWQSHERSRFASSSGPSAEGSKL